MTTLTREQIEIKRCIRFYEKRGWDWTSIVGFLCCRAIGMDFSRIWRRK